jgi:hypothetical protein
MCSSACSIQQRKPDTIAFQTTELSIIEYDIFKFFPTPSTFGTGNGNEAGGIFLSGLVCLITGWMEHIMCPTPRSSVQNYGRVSRTSQTHRHTEPTIAICRFIREWICIKRWQNFYVAIISLIPLSQKCEVVTKKCDYRIQVEIFYFSAFFHLQNRNWTRWQNSWIPWPQKCGSRTKIRVLSCAAHDQRLLRLWS